VLTLAEEPIDAPDSQALVDATVREMAERYQDDGPSPLPPEAVVPPRGTFLVARLAGRPAGCGALRTVAPGVGEVKRMYVAPHARRQGIGLVVLTELVATARRLGMHRLVLETGTLQPEAVGLYEREGWHRIANYGEFADDPRSVCFALDLS
jgi:GNAT superfamily N-acetyltransferase